MYRLVVIDDEYIVVEGIKAMIARQKLGCEVVGCAYDGIRGLEIVREQKPDLVITDIRIPGLDGLSLIETAKDFCPNTIFVVISGYAEFEYARRALSLGVKDYIEKPISIHKLKEVFGRVEKEYLQKEKLNRSILEEYSELDHTIDACMIHMSNGETSDFHHSSKEVLIRLKVMYPVFSEYKKEVYKFLCVLSDIITEQNASVDREQLVLYQKMERKGTFKDCDEYANWVLSQIAKFIEADKTGSNHRLILELLDYIQEHYDKDIGLNELADRVKLNPAYLSVLFKEEVGTSYVKYLTELRMKRAKEFLQQGLKENEVSTKVGYNNYRYFCDIFKKHVGQTPNEYKGSIRKKSSIYERGSDG